MNDQDELERALILKIVTMNSPVRVGRIFEGLAASKLPIGYTKVRDHCLVLRDRGQLRLHEVESVINGAWSADYIVEWVNPLDRLAAL